MQRNDYLTSVIHKLESRLKRLKNLSRRYSNYRLFLVFSGIIISIAALYFSDELLSGLAIFLFAAGFTGLGLIHRRINLAIKRCEHYLAIKNTHRARLQLDWQNIPAVSQSFNKEHPFAYDLDILGSQSLLRLLDTSTTNQGREKLTRWLLNTTPDPADILQRQKTVKELTPLIRLRDKLHLRSVLFSDEEFDGETLIERLKKDTAKSLPKGITIILTLLALLNIFLFILYYNGYPAYFSLSLIVYITVFFAGSKSLGNIFMDTLILNEALKQIRSVLQVIERFKFKDKPGLQDICAPLTAKKRSPSQRLKKTNYLLTAIGLRMNIVMNVILNITLPVDFYLAVILKRMKIKISNELPEWLNSWYELEALASMANFAWINKGYIFPDLKKETDYQFRVRAIGHPLIPVTTKIRNDLHLQKRGFTFLITGSNMSGKSTFLRTVGINLALAYGGGPVDARELQVPFFRIYSCININDDLNRGLSFFYAEVKRLRKILEALQQENKLPVFYLIDEIFKGTNNRERLIGSRSYVRALSQKNGLGMVTTHDLELTALSAEITLLENGHFQEHIQDNRMQFDYKLRTGPSPTTNALKIMELEGLPVEKEQDI